MSDQGFGVGRQLVDQQTRVVSRDVPFAALVLGAEATFAVVPARQLMRVQHLAVCNPTASAGTVSLWFTPAGGAKTAQLVDYPVPAKGSVNLTDLIGGLYPADAVISAAGTATLVLSGWYQAVQ